MALDDTEIAQTFNAAAIPAALDAVEMVGLKAVQKLLQKMGKEPLGSEMAKSLALNLQQTYGLTELGKDALAEKVEAQVKNGKVSRAGFLKAVADFGNDEVASDFDGGGVPVNPGLEPLRQAAKLVKQYGIDDPDGKIAVGLATVSVYAGEAAVEAREAAKPGSGAAAVRKVKTP